MSRRPFTALVAVAAVVALVAACSSSKKAAPPPASAPPTTSAPATSAPATASSSGALPAGLFGPQCASLGLNNPAIAEATAAPVGTVAGMVPFLSDVVQAATAAGLLQTFDAAPALTIFAPVNDAFAKEPAGELQSMLTDPSKKPLLVATLKYGAVTGRLDKAQLVGKHTTLEGAALTVAGSGDDYTVNGTAKIICGGFQTKNATVYLIDTVLHPPTG